MLYIGVLALTVALDLAALAFVLVPPTVRGKPASAPRP
jgi:hypothetical protein